MAKVKAKCGICGGGGKRRCPGIEGFICQHCCGEKRGSDLSCPPECHHYPFGINAYDSFLELEASLIHKMGEGWI